METLASSKSAGLLPVLILIVVSVFAIHGLGSNASSAWVSRDGSNIHWLRDILPRHEKLENIRVILLNHQTYWASNSPTMTFKDHARSMLHHIRKVNKVSKLCDHMLLRR
jgi:hypothetical protein